MTYFSPAHFLGLTVSPLTDSTEAAGGGQQTAGQGSRERPPSAGSAGAAMAAVQGLNLPLRFVPLVVYGNGERPVHPGCSLSKEGSSGQPLVHWPSDESYGFSFAANPPLFTLSAYTHPHTRACTSQSVKVLTPHGPLPLHSCSDDRP